MAEAYHIAGKIDSSEFFYKKFLNDASKKQFLRPKAERGIEMCAVARELMANPVEAKIQNIGAPINSPYAEYSPIVAYDENTLYFTSRRYRMDGSNENKVEAQTGMYYEDMYVIFRSISGSWMEPELLNINVADQHSSVVSMSPDGRRIYIYKTFSGNGNIYESEFILGTGWTFPELVGSNVNSDANEFFATITADEQRLYFVSDCYGGFGGKDIWYSQKLPNGEWGKAINMGEPINTAGDEDAPFLHPDGKTMYFSSNGHRSMGGYDIFYSQLENDGWREPTNLGYPINTTDDDHSYISTPDGNRAYYSSKGANTIGSTDIYVVEYETEEETRPDVDLSVFALLKGWVFPAPSESLHADLKITITDIKTNEMKGQTRPVERNGSFVFIIPAGNSYDVNLSLGNKSIYKERIDIAEGKVYQEMSREIFLAPSNSKTPAYAIDDNILGNILKWKLSFKDESQLIPLGSMVYLLDQKGKVIDSSHVSKDGYFEYFKLEADKPYILRPSLSKEIDGEILLSAINGESNSNVPEMINIKNTFYNKGFEPSIEKKPVPDNQIVKKTEAIVKKTTPPFAEKPLKSKSKAINDQQGELIIYFENNVASEIPADQIDKMATSIKLAIEDNPNTKITLMGSASHLPTNRSGGNIELAQLRLKYGKAALVKALKKQGLDFNKISTIDEQFLLSGPKPEEKEEYNKARFSDYQYFKLILN